MWAELEFGTRERRVKIDVSGVGGRTLIFSEIVFIALKNIYKTHAGIIIVDWILQCILLLKVGLESTKGGVDLFLLFRLISSSLS